MPTRTIRKFKPNAICHHPEHNPPSMAVFEPGEYEHECPACGNKIRFVVPPRPMLRVQTLDDVVDRLLQSRVWG